MFKKVLTLALLGSALALPVAAEDYMISTKDGACRFFYPTHKNTQGWHIEVTPASMCQNGVVGQHGQVTIYDAFSKPVEEFSGFFNGGYWLGKTALTADIVSTAIEPNGLYKVYFKLPSEAHFDLQYISQMTARRQKDTTYGAFGFCNPFRVLAHTNDFGLFQDEALVSEIIDELAMYAKRYCPAQHKIMLYAATKEQPDMTDVFYYSEIDLETAEVNVKRNQAEQFAKQALAIKNIPDDAVEAEEIRQEMIKQTEQVIQDLERQNNQESIKNTPTVDYSFHQVNETKQESQSPKGKAGENAFSEQIQPISSEKGGQALLDKVPHVLLLSRLWNRSVPGTGIVHIIRSDNQSAVANQPVTLTLTGADLHTGWGVVSGTFQYQSGLGADMTGTVQVSSFVSCSNPYCTDIQ